MTMEQQESANVSESTAEQERVEPIDTLTRWTSWSSWAKNPDSQFLATVRILSIAILIGLGLDVYGQYFVGQDPLMATKLAWMLLLLGHLFLVLLGAANYPTSHNSSQAAKVLSLVVIALGLVGSLLLLPFPQEPAQDTGLNYPYHFRTFTFDAALVQVVFLSSAYFFSKKRDRQATGWAITGMLVAALAWLVFGLGISAELFPMIAGLTCVILAILRSFQVWNRLGQLLRQGETPLPTDSDYRF